MRAEMRRKTQRDHAQIFRWTIRLLLLRYWQMAFSKESNRSIFNLVEEPRHRQDWKILQDICSLHCFWTYSLGWIHHHPPVTSIPRPVQVKHFHFMWKLGSLRGRCICRSFGGCRVFEWYPELLLPVGVQEELINNHRDQIRRWIKVLLGVVRQFHSFKHFGICSVFLHCFTWWSPQSLPPWNLRFRSKAYCDRATCKRNNQDVAGLVHQYRPSSVNH